MLDTKQTRNLASELTRRGAELAKHLDRELELRVACAEKRVAVRTHAVVRVVDATPCPLFSAAARNRVNDKRPARAPSNSTRSRP